MTNPLKRTLGLSGAVLMGLGSILGTGIFVSIGVAAGIAGPAVLVAVALAALVATLNGLSSAQLAAAHPVSGGTYAYGYRFLNPALGFAAGWLFLLAKSASAATAALGFAGYALALAGADASALRIAVGVAVTGLLTALVAGGLQRSNRVNAVIVGATLTALAGFVLLCAPLVVANGPAPFVGVSADRLWSADFLQAAALMFVAYTGYGRIATLGEEVREPARTIPRAVVITLLVTMALYLAVTAAAVSVLGAEGLAAATRATAAPLEAAARQAAGPWAGTLVAAGALTAMAGVLLNLVLGLSRILLAMARNGDMPAWLAHVDASGSPRRAVWAVGAFVALLALAGSVKLTWSFSAFTVLVYYALTNLAALRLPAASRRYPRAVPLLGLAACLSLAFWVEREVWVAGLAVVAAGIAWRAIASRARARASGS